MNQGKLSSLGALFAEVSSIRGRELTAKGFSRAFVADAVKNGFLIKSGRGLYSTPEASVSQMHSLVQIAKTVPHAVICLLSACRVHNITTQNPFEVWFAIGGKAWMPKINYVKVRVVRFSGKALIEGVEEKSIEGVTVKVYSVAKTIADLFKYRNKYGLDIAVEALRDALTQRKCTLAEINKFAEICRVSKVMEPYLIAYTSS